MHKTIVSDTSCFIVLSKINELDILQKTYGEVYTTPDVAQEFKKPLPDWVNINTPNDLIKQKILEQQIDKGEASAITLALEMIDCTVILDDIKARRIAEKLGLTITGTVGVIIRAKLKGVIPSIKPFLKKIRTTNFSLTAEIELQALKDAEEI